MSTDNRQVVLLKSSKTLNRFYVLSDESRGWSNAEEIDDFPEGIVLGIAYPCLEDGLNDFAVIRTTFETIDSYPDEPSLRDDLIVMVLEARDTLLRRLQELRDRLASRQAHFLGTDLREFKEHAINMAVKGNIRRTLDNMMKLDVFKDVAAHDAEMEGGEPSSMYQYEFRPEHSLEKIHSLPPLEFVVRLFDDVLASASDEANYENKFTFDRHIFQKFICLMFVNYATTDPIFYGTNKADYGVSASKDMSNTPLYRAVGEALREIERQLSESPDKPEEDITLATQHHRPNFVDDVTVASTGEETPPADDNLLWTVPMDDGNGAAEYPDPATLFEAPPFDLSGEPAASPAAPEPTPARAGATGAAMQRGMNPSAETAPSGVPVTPDSRMVCLPAGSTTEQRIMVPLNSITMAAELLKASGAPAAAMYAQMILTGADALLAALREWGVVEPPKTQ